MVVDYRTLAHQLAMVRFVLKYFVLVQEVNRCLLPSSSKLSKEGLVIAIDFDDPTPLEVSGLVSVRCSFRLRSEDATAMDVPPDDTIGPSGAKLGSPGEPLPFPAACAVSLLDGLFSSSSSS